MNEPVDMTSSTEIHFFKLHGRQARSVGESGNCGKITYRRFASA